MRFFVFLFAVVVFGDESFITIKEYGEAIYKRYEKLSCVDCHGQNAEGKTLAYYERKRKLEAIVAPKIRNLTSEELKNGLRKHSFGPSYYLSDAEIEALAAYLANP
ncbi:MAG: cytochrome c [Helicobacteraceae bacterium]|jgi:mono/diheme cytochrome c family protein|nr:cytochrome c [Helicobacteraceae bacterium]